MELISLNQQMHKRVTTELFDIAVGIIGRRNRSDSEWDSCGQKIIECASRRALTGHIAIKTEDDVIGIAAEDPGMGGRKRRSLWRYGAAHSSPLAGDGIEIAL